MGLDVELTDYAQVSLCWMYCWTWTNWPFLFDWRIIPGHSSQFLSIRIVYFSSVQLWQASTNVLNMFKTFVFPMRILFIPDYAYWKHVVFFFIAQPTCCILVFLAVYYVVRACNISQETCEIRWMEWECNNKGLDKRRIRMNHIKLYTNERDHSMGKTKIHTK